MSAKKAALNWPLVQIRRTEIRRRSSPVRCGFYSRPHSAPIHDLLIPEEPSSVSELTWETRFAQPSDDDEYQKVNCLNSARYN